MLSHGPARGAVTVAALLAVGWVDYITGPRLAFFPFYLCVLVGAALRSSRRVATLYAGVASVIFLLVDLATTPELAATIYPYWRAVAQLMSFSLVTYVIPTLRDERRRLAESERLLIQQQDELHTLTGTLLAALEEASRSRALALEALGGEPWQAVSTLEPGAPAGVHTVGAPSRKNRPSW